MWAMLTRTAPSLTSTPTWATSTPLQRALSCKSWQGLGCMALKVLQVEEHLPAYSFARACPLADAVLHLMLTSMHLKLMQFSRLVQVLRPLH